ncbi:aldehyde dehydrogenase family 3 member F1-like isoform X1 [Impatiens glandulifera]|uniref:aldehyde dehydrogenase family 3 member F1-like isoform X1 n=1 Tax=Impatiens glandulifera TaxID=253017 RepID=UPI001FB11624|nr:aldehyde dehydrogenase family 3 member F1-like isoform X1 [Impatiens glandulifera]
MEEPTKESWLERQMEELRETFESGKTRKAAWRKSQLKALLSLLKEKEEDIFLALQQDLGKHPAETFRDELGTLIKSINFALDGLKKWMSSKKAKVPLAVFPSKAEIVPEPLGLVLIISSWNFPFGLSLEPLIGAIAAGNVVVLKPSELSPMCSSILARTVGEYLDKSAVKVLEGGVSLGEQLLQQKWDKIFFTGSGRVGRIVMTAAAKNLTPVVLELGGKCPAIVDSLACSRERKVAIKRILSGKFGTCAGQACLSIDYILTEKRFASTLVEEMKEILKEQYGENPRVTNSVSRIINKQHFARLENLLNDPFVKASVVYGGSLDEENLFIEPTILINPPLKSAIMTEEIFGPLLPIITLDNIEDCVEFIKSRPKALAVYAFTSKKRLQKRLVAETSSGGLVFNDTILQYALDKLPFGGVGESGIGRYHGKFSFDVFTHEKSVLKRGFWIDFWFRYPPWDFKKLQLFKASYRYNYLKVGLIALGIKKTY